ncbi:MAG: AMP-binding protein, partial [Lachnospiraceae bacterium]|nr:AMP-binding protein [Lachnospiraceae bacterium]
NGLTMNALFNFVFGLVLSKFLYKDEALYTTIYNGRSDSRMDRTISMLVKTLPVYLKYEEKEEITEVIRRLRTQMESAQRHDLFSFSEIAAAYGIEADVMFVYHGSSFRFSEIGGIPVTGRVLEIDTAKTPFSLDVFPAEEGFRFRFEWDESLYNEHTARAFGRCIETVLSQLGKVRRLADLSYIGEEDKALYRQFNDTEVPLPAISFNKLFEAQAKRVPERKALIAPDGNFSYRELNEAANRIAHGLRERGLSQGSKALVLMPRVRNAYAVRQGVLKSGAAFVPVDPQYPDERIEYIITESGSSLIITTEDLLEEKKRLFEKTGIPALSDTVLLETANTADPDWVIDPDALAYFIFTSGSTGKPKGVMIAHRNLVNYCMDGKNLATWEYRLVGDEAVSCSFASLSFDVSLQEECVPLSHGTTAVMAGEAEIENPLLLAQMFEKYGVNLTFLTPSYVANVVDVEPFLKTLRSLKVLDMGAESVPAELIAKLRKAGVEAELFNGYGPTETTVTCTYSHIQDEYVTIGKPVGNTKLYILDPHGHILPIGALGDLTIAGAGVGLGYLGLPEKTAERFITVEGLPAFRSG